MVGMEVEQSKNPLHSSWQSLLFSPIKNNNPLFNRTSRQDWFVRRMGIGGPFAVSLLVWAFLNDMCPEKFMIRVWVALKNIAFQHWLATNVGDKRQEEHSCCQASPSIVKIQVWIHQVCKTHVFCKVNFFWSWQTWKIFFKVTEDRVWGLPLILNCWS